MFSILIPSWNNLEYLKLCVESILKNSTFSHQIILHINEGSDGSLVWAQKNNLEFTSSENNIGICRAVNLAAKLARFDYILFMNDDMYALPGWDSKLYHEIRNADSDCFMFSSTMVEPYDTKNKCVVVADYGRKPEEFREQALLSECSSLNKSDWSGSTWPPCIVHKKWWDKVGGYSEEFSPGMSSDNDFAMKMWNAGCRIFKGVGSSRVYHFISKSTGRIRKNDGRKQFLNKWGLKQSTFDRYYIKRGMPYEGKLREPGFSPGLFLQKMIARFAG